jgi:hypothetical protein
LFNQNSEFQRLESRQVERCRPFQPLRVGLGRTSSPSGKTPCFEIRQVLAKLVFQD